MRKLVVLLLACVACAAASAQDNVLVGRLPANLSPDGAIALTRAALLARNWKMLASEATSITAQNGNSQVRVYVAGDALRYADEAGAGREAAPPRLIAALRADLASALGEDVRAAPAPRTAAQPMMGRTFMAKPADVDAATMLRAVRIGLESRRFTILPSSEEGVIVAQYSTRSIGTTWRLFLAGNELQFTDTTTRMSRGGGGESAEVPDIWIRNARADIENAIPQARQEQGQTSPSEPARPASNATQRLRSLKQLFDSGVITRDEYDRKRAEILRDL